MDCCPTGENTSQTSAANVNPTVGWCFVPGVLSGLTFGSLHNYIEEQAITSSTQSYHRLPQSLLRDYHSTLLGLIKPYVVLISSLNLEGGYLLGGTIVIPYLSSTRESYSPGTCCKGTCLIAQSML